MPADKYTAYKQYLNGSKPTNAGNGNGQINPQLYENFKQELMKEAGLTAEQAEKTIKITLEHKTKEKQIRQTNKGNTAVIKTEVQKLNVETVTKLREFLTDEQIQKILVLQQKYAK